MIICFAEVGWEDYQYWQENNKKTLKRINELIKDIIRNPYDKNGIGKPEILKGAFSGYYSRRITDEHRIIYKISDEKLFIIQCRFHYQK